MTCDYSQRIDADLKRFRARSAKMKRDIVFTGKPGLLAECLGLSRERCREIDDAVNEAIDNNDSLQTVIERMNERDLTDAEWTAFIYAIGFYQGTRMR